MPLPRNFLDFFSKNGALWRVLGGLINIGLAHDSGLESEPPLITVWANNPDNKLDKKA